RVLAHDVERFAVLINYRWTQEPPDPLWLKRQALERLSRAERADDRKVEAATEAILAERRAMWRRLSELTGVSLAELQSERQAIQNRVERMVAAVEERRGAVHAAAKAAEPEIPADASAWERAWNTVVTTLTTSPERADLDPLTLPEQDANHRLLDGLSLEVAAEIESHPEMFSGLSTERTSRRRYPEQTIAAHVVGVRRPIADEELAARQARFEGDDPLDYRPGDRQGQTGVEAHYERLLRGRRGLRRVVRNGRGEIVASEVVRHPQPGRDLVLTLNLELQRRMEQALDETLGPSATTVEEAPVIRDDASAGAALVALDVRTGAVLAAVSAPRFDLEVLAEPDADSWRQIVEDPRRPLFDRATRMAVAPGSTFKALTAIALLESGLDPDATIFCRGYLDTPNRYRCYTYRHYGYGHGDTNLSDALARSCNVYFFSAAREVGPEPLVEWAGRFGFGRPTGIDLPGEEAGTLPAPPRERIRLAAANVDGSLRDPDSGRGATGLHWYPGDTLGLAIGQSRLTTTPLQVARLMAAIGGDGRLVTPHVVRGFAQPQTADSSEQSWPVREAAPIAGLSAETLRRVREGLERVVADPRGTGYKQVRLKEVAIAGKTGTAEVGPGRRDHAWFAGYVPADRPKVAFAVVLEHGGSGGSDAGPLARRLVQELLALGIIEAARE
ncbi:MAG: hypothetical protein KY476_13055, partial [Planctomycetes bacterium]|nr:hypothetical protein [Planctomycetota bacterium]